MLISKVIQSRTESLPGKEYNNAAFPGVAFFFRTCLKGSGEVLFQAKHLMAEDRGLPKWSV